MSEDSAEYKKSPEYIRHRQIAFAPELLAKGKKKKSPANELASFVIDHVKSVGGTARRVNTQGQYDEKTGKWRTSGMRKGFEDVDACVPVYFNTHSCGRFKIGVKVAVEIKIGKDQLSEYQVKRKAELAESGGYYIIASTKEQFTGALQAIIDGINMMLDNKVNI